MADGKRVDGSWKTGPKQFAAIRGVREISIVTFLQLG
jgi:hypothetical protein